MPETHILLDTVEIDVAPHDALRVLRRLDERNETWQFISEDCGAHHLKLKCDLDGCDGPVDIILNKDGTWRATTHMVIGEKEA